MEVITFIAFNIWAFQIALVIFVILIKYFDIIFKIKYLNLK